MSKLNQILAVEKGMKARSYRSVTDLHKQIQKNALVTGMTRSYEPVNDEDEQLPSETTLVQVNVKDVIEQASKEWTASWDVTATKEWGNTKAFADVKDPETGDVIVEAVPVTFLLFLEKQLSDLHTFVDSLPILDPAEKWTLDSSTGLYTTDEITTHRTKKMPRVIVKYEATTEHPAQTELFSEDKIVGYWKARKFSGAIPEAKRKEMLKRVEALQNAVKRAREEANSIVVDDQKVSAKLIGYVFG